MPAVAEAGTQLLCGGLEVVSRANLTIVLHCFSNTSTSVTLDVARGGLG